MRQQRGVALLTILLLVVAITVVAGSMLASQKIMVREYNVAQTQAQFNQYVLYGEAVAKQMIFEDSQANQTDSLQDIWTKPIAELSLDNAKVKLKIVDESQRFNINNLYHNGKVDNHAMAYFRALLLANGLDMNIANAVLDWQDPDSDSAGEGGAEFEFYQSLGKKHTVQIANQPFYTVDELINVRGMDKEKLAKIKPLLTAVPFFLPMNVNLLKPELLVPIGLIMPNQPTTDTPQTASTPNATPTKTPQTPLNLMEIMNWATMRETSVPIDNVAVFWQLPMLAGVSEEQKNTMTPLLDVQSYAFRLFITVQVDDKERFFTSSLAKIPEISNNPLSNSGSHTKVEVFNRQILAFLPVEATLSMNVTKR